MMNRAANLLKIATSGLIACIAMILLVLYIPQSQAEFTDLPESHHHYFPLSFLELEGIINGYDDGTVRPEAFINRAELIKILVEARGNTPSLSQFSDCFPDVKEEWYAPYICFAASQGWVQGYPDGTFKPGQNINKAEALKIILEAYQIDQVLPTPELMFKDMTFEDWFVGYVAAALQKNLLEEEGGDELVGWNLRNRGEIAEMVARVLMLEISGDAEYTPWLRSEFQNFHYLHVLRRREGVMEKLTMNPVLMKVAREHAKDMGENLKTLSHTSSDGITQSFDRIKKAIKEQDDPNFNGRTGENVGGGGSWASDPYQVVRHVHDNIFMPEDPNVCNHRTTLLSQCLPYTEVGVGVYVNEENQTFFVNDFITRVQADTMEMRAGLQLPAEYTDTNRYTIVSQEENYATVLTTDCSQVRVRTEYFIEVGVFITAGKCQVYEHPWSRSPKWDVLRDYLKDQVFSVKYTSSYSTPERPSANETFIAIQHQVTNGWQIVGNENVNIPAYFDLNETATVTFKNTNTNEELTFRLAFSDGWVEITQL